MKKFSAIAIATLFLAFSACNKKEDVSPASTNASDPASAAAALDSLPEAARLAHGRAIETPITGAIDGVPFSGNFRITKFIHRGGQVYAVGHLADLTGITSRKPIVTVLENKHLEIPVSFPQAVPAAPGALQQVAPCNILNLVLGPLHLNLLGLVIDLNQVVLNITGATGAGNLLGNLLCAITGLLDPLGNLAQIVTLLNQLVALIGTL
jgi:hypothetical protein